MNNSETLNPNLHEINRILYIPCDLLISNLKNEIEGKEYDACQFELNGRNVISRSSKITPKKIGQFVTFWKRNSKGITAPYSEKDSIDFFVINVKGKGRFGQFVFPKSALLKNGILSTQKKDGKRGFRVYPIWDEPQNKQAKKTQAWQLKYFYEISDTTDFEKVSGIYHAM